MISSRLGDDASSGITSRADWPLPEPPVTVVPGPTTTVTTTTTDYAGAAQDRADVIKALSIFGGVILAAGALVFFTRESRSRRDRRVLHPGSVFCKWGVRYRMDTRGRTVRIGNC